MVSNFVLGKLELSLLGDDRAFSVVPKSIITFWICPAVCLSWLIPIPDVFIFSENQRSRSVKHETCSSIYLGLLVTGLHSHSEIWWGGLDYRRL